MKSYWRLLTRLLSLLVLGASSCTSYSRHFLPTVQKTEQGQSVRHFLVVTHREQVYLGLLSPDGRTLAPSQRLRVQVRNHGTDLRVSGINQPNRLPYILKNNTLADWPAGSWDLLLTLADAGGRINVEVIAYTPAGSRSNTVARVTATFHDSF